MCCFALSTAAALILTAGAALAGDLPDPKLTPGALNDAVTQANLQQTVCVKGWTQTVRPPQSYTNRLKKQQIRAYGYADGNPKHYEEDHLIPLSVGGHPEDARNLWPQPRLSQWNAARKDQLEYALYRAVCRGEVSLAEARQAFASDWIAAYKRYGALMRKYQRGEAD